MRTGGRSVAWNGIVASVLFPEPGVGKGFFAGSCPGPGLSQPILLSGCELGCAGLSWSCSGCSFGSLKNVPCAGLVVVGRRIPFLLIPIFLLSPGLVSGFLSSVVGSKTGPSDADHNGLDVAMFVSGPWHQRHPQSPPARPASSNGPAQTC